MDIRLRNSKPFTVWLCYFLAVSIFIGLLITGAAALSYTRGNLGELKACFTDYQSSFAFKERTGSYYQQLFSLAVRYSTSEYLEMTKQSLADEGDNLKYYAVNRDTGLLLSNIEEQFLPADPNKRMPDLPNGYDYFWYFDGQTVRVVEDGQPVDVERLDSGYRGIIPSLREYSDQNAALINCEVLLAVKDPVVKNPYGNSRYYEERQFLSALGWIYLSLFAAAIALSVYVIIKRREKQEFDRKLASWSGRVWLEIKMLLTLMVVILFIGAVSNYSLPWNGPYNWTVGMAFVSCMMLLVFWWGYVMFMDLIFNRKSFFTHNSIHSLLTGYHEYEKKYSWQKAMLNRAYVLVAAEAVLALTSVMFLMGAAMAGSGGLALLVALLIAAAGIYLIYRYLKHFDQTLIDLGKLTDHIERMKNGDMGSRLEFTENSDMHKAACNLNSIQEGMGMAIAEKMKSERMKIELITNVSHDLKTPLTSIISYVDLLSKEEGLPEHINDYVNILVHKSERLKNLIQDLFDLSKASSDAIALDMENIDLARLIKQTLADMGEQIADSGLTFRTNIPDQSVNILGDGQKLYRVLENLITNTLKYSLIGSRVFIDLTVDERGAVATIKNTANYEMNFNEEEILQRFVRGDESRTTEGSGLGLAIAQSFTQISGGRFEIIIDGDLFKVEMSFQTV